jgi:protein MBA1
VDAGTRLGYRFSSKRGLFKPALYKPQTAKLVPTAKALHRAMYEALARGDKEGLHKVCGVELRNRFERAIDGRDPGRRFEWELVRYNKTLWGYPRIVDNKLNAIPIPDQRPNSRPPFLRQVVVAIASTQRRVQYDHSKAGGGRVVRGSEVEVDVVENVVMACTLDRDTYVATDWKIIALVDETTPEKWTQEMELVREFQLGDAAKKHRLVDRPQR